MRTQLIAVASASMLLTACVADVGEDVALGETEQAGTDLQGVDLQGVDLQGVDLQGVDLQGVDLQGVDLQGLSLSGVALADVHLENGTELVGERWSSTYGTWELRYPDRYYLLSNGVWVGPYGTGLEGTRLVATLTNNKTATLRIAPKSYTKGVDGGIRHDPTTNHMVNPDYQSNYDVWQYKLQIYGDDGYWHNVCPGEGYGTMIAGTWNRTTGAYLSSGTTYACKSGVISKCISQWGYKPWKQLVDANGVQRDPYTIGYLHRSCVRAARADYCGSGISHTANGTLVDMFDKYGFNQTVYRDGYVTPWFTTYRGDERYVWHGEAVFYAVDGAKAIADKGRLATNVWGLSSSGLGNLECSDKPVVPGYSIDTVAEIGSYSGSVVGILSREHQVKAPDGSLYSLEY